MSERPFDFEFNVYQPAGSLGMFVESIWFARGTIPYTREKIAPTGSTVAVIVLGDPIIETADNGAATPFRAERGFLVGPHTRPVINEPTGETHAVGVITSPVGCRAVFGIAPETVRGRVVDLETVWGVAPELRGLLVELQDPEEAIEAVVAALERTVDISGEGLGRVPESVELLRHDPDRSIASIAAEVGRSHGHLDREFTRVVGLSPRALARLLRLNRVLAELDVSNRVPWVEVALTHGWFDQAHFIRDFKRHTGVTPSAYLAAQRANYSGAEVGEGAGFVPEM